MPYQTAEEAKKQYIERMGEPLGCHFNSLWQRIVLLHVNWREYVELFGTNERRIKLLNEAAPAFFRMIQDELWNSILLHIARLLDEPKMGKFRNLSVRGFTDMVDDVLKMPLAKLIDEAAKDAEFAREWRNRVIAHYDLELALNDKAAAPLPDASRAKVNVALARLADIMNAVQKHYMDGGTAFNAVSRHDGALNLLHLIRDAVVAKAGSEARLKAAIDSGSMEEIATALDEDTQEPL